MWKNRSIFICKTENIILKLKNYKKKNKKGKPYWVVIPEEEIYKRYHDKLPIFFVEDIWKDEYVNLEQDGK